MKSTRLKKMLIAVITVGALSGMTAGVILALMRDLPQIKTLETFTPSAVTRIYSADHVLLDELFVEKRDIVPLATIPQPLISALLTTEDRQFYSHSGLAIKGILRAIVQNIRKGRYAQGASTLTQQLAKTLFLTPRKTISRKLREAVLAMQLERRYTKNEILGLYLNQIYLGSGAYGVSSAASIYFGKAVEDLTLAQCALIAGLPKAPSRYSPFNNIDLARKRRNLVLDMMLATGAIGPEQHQNALSEPILLLKRSNSGPKAPYFVSDIRKQLETMVGADQLYKGGLTVYTTLDHDHQQTAESAVQHGLSQLEQRMLRNGRQSPEPQAALVALDIGTGAIVALVGGRPAQHAGFNRATVAQRQPGSAFKPIVYALAIERGFEQTHVLRDAPVVFPAAREGQDWQPQNFTQDYAGEISIRWSLTHSKNIPAVRLLETIGPSSVVQFAQRLGFQTMLAPQLSLALGTSEVRLIDLTAAYCVFANAGRYIAPYAVTEIRDADNRTIWRAKTEQHLAMRPTSAAIMTDILQGVISSGTGRKASVLPGPLAGKTGTTNDYKDALFIGYSPALCVGVWVGNDNATPLGPGETGARAALPIWMAFMQNSLQTGQLGYFDLPEGLERVAIDPRSGKRVADGTPSAVRALLKKP